MSNEVILFKALILYHKVLRQGHNICLKEQYNGPSFLNDLKGMMVFKTGYYHELTLDYINFLSEKLSYHKSHPYFSGTFDFEEYVTLRGVEDPNDGYETITELLSLIEKIDKLQKHIFRDLKSTWRNEVRIAALVPLVEESDGIYKFINSMMTAMHTS